MKCTCLQVLSALLHPGANADNTHISNLTGKTDQENNQAWPATGRKAAEAKDVAIYYSFPFLD